MCFLEKTIWKKNIWKRLLDLKAVSQRIATDVSVWRKYKIEQLAKIIERRFLESADAFCVIPDTESVGKFIFVILQVTVAEKHPIEAAGLESIFMKFDDSVQKSISRKYLAFVTDRGSKLSRFQPIEVQNGVALETGDWAHSFDQIIYRHTFS